MNYKRNLIILKMKHNNPFVFLVIDVDVTIMNNKYNSLYGHPKLFLRLLDLFNHVVR